MTRTALYRFFNADGEVLYVGITGNVPQRWRAHEREKPWWPDIVEKTFEWYDDRDTAAREELRAILNENPIHNVRDVPGKMPARRDPDAPVGNWGKYVREVTGGASARAIARRINEYAAEQARKAS